MSNANGTVEAKEVDINDINEAELGYEDVQIGFPPYWTPEMRCVGAGCEGRILGDKELKCSKHGSEHLKGNKFWATIIGFDKPKDSFGRFVLRAMCRHHCSYGDMTNVQDIDVATGQYFTISVYSALPLEQYMNKTVIVTTQYKRWTKSQTDGQTNTLWIFGLKTDKKTAELIEAERLKHSEAAAKAFAELNAKRLAEKQANDLASTIGSNLEREAMAKAAAANRSGDRAASLNERLAQEAHAPAAPATQPRVDEDAGL
jgi:hypothetical protein